MMDAGPNDASSVCPTTTMAVPILPAPHIAACTPITYATNPPTSGPHYPIWAAFKWYDAPVPRGFTVHSMEHGAVVISYNCPNGCADELGALAAFLNARPADPLCSAPLKSRIIVTPDLYGRVSKRSYIVFYAEDEPQLIGARSEFHAGAFGLQYRKGLPEIIKKYCDLPIENLEAIERKKR